MQRLARPPILPWGALPPVKRMAWDGRALPVTWQGAPEIMGVLNLTPDSFSDGGELLAPGGALKRDALLRRAEAFVKEGAAYLDLGAESTRPGAEGLSEEEEWTRIQEALELLAPRFDVKLSVDTSTPEILRRAPALGAALLNDVRALQRPGALAAAAESSASVCLMHMQGSPASMQDAPHYDDVVGEVLAFLQARMGEAEAAGIARDRILLDPGFGFGKTLAHNLSLFRALPRFVALGVPVLMGVSRKRMLGALTGRESPKARVVAGAVLAAEAARHGVAIIRTHDVAETRDALAMVQALDGPA
jgi:dihydropteroate synthase